MPLGTRHEVTGLLREQGHDWTLLPLESGTWRLDVEGPPEALAGQRVTATGTRAGFDLLDVDDIRSEDAPSRPRAWWRKLFD